MADNVSGVGQRLGNYRILRPLGQGAFATVYLGEHVYLRTQAAIKVLQTQIIDNSLERFLVEARIIARLRHPSIVGLLEFGVEGNTPFLVMEYAPHGSLRQRHPRGARLSLAEIVPYVRQISAGLQYAHDEKLIHRDIKPENILLGADDELLLADFGIARIAQTHYQQTQEVAGTLTYMAPEQLQGRPLQASDQYALGAVVYEWLSGSCPFHGSFAEIATQHLYADPPSLCAKIPEIPPTVEQVVLTALAKNPQARFASIQAFATALEAACKPATLPPRLSSSNVPLYAAPSPSHTKGTIQPSVQTLQSLPQTDPPQQPIAFLREKPRKGQVAIVSRVMLFFILALLIIGGSGLFYYIWIARPAWVHSQATSPGQIYTTNSNSPALIYATATSGSPDHDTAMNQSDSSWGWIEFPLTQGGSCAYRDGAYYATISQQGFSPCLAQGIEVNNFAYEVQVTISAGDEGGLIFRSANMDSSNAPSYTLNNYYIFSISQTGHYSLYYYQSDTSKIQLTGGSSASIITGSAPTNVLTVIARGSDIYLYVNHKFLAQVKDSNRLSGYVGVFAQDDTNPTDIRFSNARVWSL